MTRKRQPYKTYTREFKVEAVRLMQASDRPSAEIAAELGVRRNQLYKWKEQLERPRRSVPFRARLAPSLKAQQSEMAKLQKGERPSTRGGRDTKKGRRVLCARPQVKYAFIRQQQRQHHALASPV